MRIAVTGAAGRLGSVLSSELASAGHDVVALGHADLDVTNADQVAAVMTRLEPHAIVNCSAYNAVDAAEADQAAAYALNAHAPSLLAAAATSTGALLVHFSTDFVFDGTATEPYSEEAPTHPLGVYGASKLSGEHEVRRTPRHYILRVESLFGGLGVKGHRASVDAIIETIASGGVVKAFVDRSVTPSYVPDVVQAVRALVEGGAAYGTYHCVNSGWTTWYDLAHAVAARMGLPASVEPVLVGSVRTVAPRPRFCALSNRKLIAAGVPMADWLSAVGRHVAGRSAQPLAATSSSKGPI
jgi:dTDP-4-dehydrorhamnose reductase